MPKAKVGILIKTDVAAKVYLLQLPDRDSFLIMDIDDRQIRLSVGLEDHLDLLADINQALGN